MTEEYVRKFKESARANPSKKERVIAIISQEMREDELFYKAVVNYALSAKSYLKGDLYG